EQLSAELTVAGEFEIFGQRQSVVLGVNRSDTDGSGTRDYESLIEAYSFRPYQPYAGGPVFCRGSGCPAGRIPELSPPIDIYAFDPNHLWYTEPGGAVPSGYYRTYSQVQSGAYLNLNLTAFDRWHLQTGVRWSRYELDQDRQNLCSIALGCTLGEVLNST